MGDDPRRQELERRELLARSPLAARLLRRREAPLGVIDVGHALRHHARLSGWLAERLGLLESLTMRYRCADAGAQAGIAFVLAEPHRRWPDDHVVGVTPSAYAHAAEAQHGLPTFVSTAALPPEPRTDAGTRRVRRAGAAPPDVTQPVAAPAAPETAARRDAPTAEPGRAHEQARPAGTEAGALDLPLHTRERATAASESRPAEEEAGGTKDRRITPEGVTPQPAAAADRTEHPRPAARELSVEARRTNVGTEPPDAPLELSHAPRRLGVSPEDVRVAPARTPERRPAAEQPPVGMTPVGKTREQRPPRARQTTPREQMPLPPAHAPQTAEASAVPRDSAPKAAAAELPAPTPRGAAPELIWRASPSAPPRADAAGAADGETPFTRTPPAGAPRARAPQSEGSETDAGAPRVAGAGRHGRDFEIDVEGLTERVSRIISRQLIVERERRGFKG